MLKAACQLHATGCLPADAEIVLFNTGSGLNYNHLSEPEGLPVLDHTAADVLDRVRG
ncbi:MAG: hypothetical protein ACK50P_17885 [Planctomycetaceae bacterium]